MKRAKISNWIYIIYLKKENGWCFALLFGRRHRRASSSEGSKWLEQAFLSLPPHFSIPYLKWEGQDYLPANTGLQFSCPWPSLCPTIPSTSYLQLLVGLLNAATTNMPCTVTLRNWMKGYPVCSQILLSLWSLFLTQLCCYYINPDVFMRYIYLERERVMGTINKSIRELVYFPHRQALSGSLHHCIARVNYKPFMFP